MRVNDRGILSVNSDSLDSAELARDDNGKISKRSLGLTCATIALTALLGIAALQTAHEPAAADPGDTAPAQKQQAKAEPRDPGAYRIVHMESESQGPVTDDYSPVTLSLHVKPGDTLMALLTGAGVESRDAYAAIEAMKEVYSPRHLRPGQEIAVSLLPRHPLDGPGPDMLQALHLRPSVTQRRQHALPREAVCTRAQLSVQRVCMVPLPRLAQDMQCCVVHDGVLCYA